MHSFTTSQLDPEEEDSEFKVLQTSLRCLLIVGQNTGYLFQRLHKVYPL